MFDVSQFAINDSAILHLTHPKTEMPLFADVDETQPVTITLYSTASKAYRKQIDALTKKNQRLQASGKKQTPEEIREAGVEFLVALTVSSENLALNGKPVQDAEGFRELYSDERYSWLRKQVDTFLGNTNSFLSPD